MSLPNELLSYIVEALFLDAQTSASARQALRRCLSVSHSVRLIARSFVFKDITIEFHADSITQPARTHALWELLVSDPTVLQHISSLSIEMTGTISPTVDPPIFCALLRLLRNAPLQSFTIRHQKGAPYRLKELHPTIIDSLALIRGNAPLRQLYFIGALDTPRQLVCTSNKEDSVQKLCLPAFHPNVHWVLFDDTDMTVEPLSTADDAFPPLPSLVDLEVLHIGHFITKIYGPTKADATPRSWDIRIKRLRVLEFIKEDRISSEKQWEMIKLAKGSLETLSVVTTWIDMTNTGGPNTGMRLEDLPRLTSFDISVYFVHGILLMESPRDIIQSLSLFFKSGVSGSKTNLENITINLMCSFTGVRPPAPDAHFQQGQVQAILRFFSCQGWEELDGTFSSQRFSKLKHVWIRITIAEGYRGLQPLVKAKRKVLDDAIEAFQEKALGDSRGSAQVHISARILDQPDVMDMDNRDRWLFHDSMHVGEPL